MPAYTSELIAVKLNKKGSKVHIAFKQSYMAICGNRFKGRVDQLTKQDIKDIETINQILKDDHICSKCKKDVSAWLSTNFIREDIAC